MFEIKQTNKFKKHTIVYGGNNWLDIAEENVSELKDFAVESIQNKTQKEKKDLKK